MALLGSLPSTLFRIGFLGTLDRVLVLRSFLRFIHCRRPIDFDDTHAHTGHRRLRFLFPHRKISARLVLKQRNCC